MVSQVSTRVIKRGSAQRCGAQQPDVPTTASFTGEAVDFMLFPEGYLSASDQKRAESLRKLAFDLGAPLLVGAIEKNLTLPAAPDRCFFDSIPMAPAPGCIPNTPLWTQWPSSGRIGSRAPCYRPLNWAE